jgi:oligoendopeptidase F
MRIIRNTVLLVSVILSVPSPAARGAEPEQDRWNLADIYPTQDAWREAKDAVMTSLKKIPSYQGRLDDSKSLKEALDTIFGIQKEVQRVYSYASMLSDEDTRIDRHAQMREEADLLESAFAERTSFLNPELIAIGETKIQSFLRAEPGLGIYKQFLRNALRQAPHTRSSEVEQVVAEVSRVAGAPANVRRTLVNADVPWPSVTLSDGNEVRLDPAGYTKYRAVLNRDDRKRVFDTFWQAWKAYERTLGVSLNSQLARDHFYAKVRHYPNSLASALGANNIPEAIYRTLVKETRANLGTLHRYLKLRARMLEVDDLAYYDIYPPLIKTELTYSLPQAKQLSIACSRPLGEEYISVMRKGFAARWVDFHPRPGKRSGAYMNGSVYDVHPFMLMNYNHDLESVSTLVHEFGHALHSHLANTNQPFPTADYAIFVAEIASTSNESLLIDHVIKNAKNDEEKLYYLGFNLEGIRGTFFRQTMFAEFELKVHDLVDQGEALTGARFTEIYKDILRRYHGHDEGVMTIDDAYTIEWAYIPHFYYNFYVYQYATSIAGGSLLAADILDGKPGARDRYLNLLRAGASKYPHDLLLDAGVDLTTPRPYRALVSRMNQVMDEIETILERRPSSAK